MVVFRREEPFRYTFNEEVKGLLTITSVDDEYADSKKEYVHLLDLSPNGMKIKCDMDLSIRKNKYEFQVNFILNNKELSLIGIPIWKKQIGPHSFSYGIRGYNNERTKREITEELKIFARH